MARWVLLVVTTLALCAGCGLMEPPSLSDQAVKQLRGGHYDEAIRICDEALRQKPDDAEIYMTRGRAHHYRNADGDLQRAIADFSEAIRLAPKEPEAFYCRAIVYRDLGDMEKSRADQTSARQIDPRISEVYAQLPDLTPPSQIDLRSTEPEPETSSAGTSTGGGTTTEPFPLPLDERRLYEKLKRKFEPENSNFGIPGIDRRANTPVPDRNVPSNVDPRARPPQAVNVPSQDNLDREEPDTREDNNPAPTSRERRARSPVVVNPWSTDGGNPLSPWQPRSQYSSSNPASPFRTPLRSPFPQYAPRPTGLVEEPAGSQPAQPRQYYNNAPSTLPGLRPFEDY